MVHLMASALLATTVLAQVPFALDTTFRTQITQQYVNSIALMPDGNLLLSGTMRFPGDLSNRLLTKLDINGDRITSFPFGYGGGKLSPWNNHYYVAVGQGVQRLLPDGLIDPSFIGLNDGPYFSSLQGGDYHVYPDGRVLVSGRHILSDTERGFVGNHNLIWFSNTGYLDTTRVHRKGNGTVYQFKELPSGGFICSGTCTEFEGLPVERIFRTNAEGVPDTTFHSEIYWGQAVDYLPLLDGRVYVAGRYQRSDVPGDTLHISRLQPNGSLDPAFTPPQFTLGALPNTGGVGPLVVGARHWGQGHLLVTGQFQFVNGQPRRGICVLDTNGVLTEDFDDCGVSTFAYMGITNAAVIGLIADADSTHYYIWGTYTGYTDGTTTDPLQRFVSRLHVGDFTTSAPPLSVGEELGVRVYPNPSSGPVTVAIEQLPKHGDLLVRDAMGRVVHRQRITGYHTTFVMGQAGVYSVELVREGRTVNIERLVIQP